MELKSLEMQIALPRTLDAGKNLHHLQHEGQIINENAGQEMEKALVQKRQHVLKQEQKDSAILKDQRDSKNNQEHRENKRQNGENIDQKRMKQYHPFKGNHIDFSG